MMATVWPSATASSTAAADAGGKRANPSRYFGDDLDVWHATLRKRRPRIPKQDADPISDSRRPVLSRQIA
jgi:hypothetical protein